MGARIEALGSRRNSGLTVNELRGQLGILSDQEMYARHFDYDKMLAETRKDPWKRTILKSADAIQKKSGTAKELVFAQLPSALTEDVLAKAEQKGMKFLAVPAIPFENPGEIAAALSTATPLAAPTQLVEMYGSYLSAALNGAAPLNFTGHYAFIDEPGAKTELSSLLDIEDLGTISPKELTQKIRNNGKNALQELGIGSGAYIDIITLEEAELSSALGNTVYGITGTIDRIADHPRYFVRTKDGLQIIDRDDVSESTLRPRLVIRFGERNTNPFYLKPPYNHVDPAVRAEILKRRTSPEPARSTDETIFTPLTVKDASDETLIAASKSVGHPLSRHRATMELATRRELASTS